MTDCRTPELRDLLPDFVADTLGESDQERLSAHLDVCAACQADVALLRRVRAARPVVAAADVAAIVARLPKPIRHTDAPARPGLTLHTTAAAPTGTRAAATGRGRLFRGPSLWRMAAAVGVVLAGGFSMVVARRGLTGITAPGGGAPLAVESTTTARAMPDTSTVPAPGETLAVRGTAAAAATPTAADVPVSYGDLGDYSEEELQRILERLDKWDGAPGTEPLPNLPIVPTRGGTTP